MDVFKVGCSPPCFKIATVFQDRHRVSRSPPCFKIATVFQDRHRVSRSPPCFKIATVFQDRHRVSRSPPCFKIATVFQDRHRVSRSPPCFKIGKRTLTHGYLSAESKLFLNIFEDFKKLILFFMNPGPLNLGVRRIFPEPCLANNSECPPIRYPRVISIQRK